MYGLRNKKRGWLSFAFADGHDDEGPASHQITKMFVLVGFVPICCSLVAFLPGYLAHFLHPPSSTLFPSPLLLELACLVWHLAFEYTEQQLNLQRCIATAGQKNVNIKKKRTARIFMGNHRRTSPIHRLDIAFPLQHSNSKGSGEAISCAGCIYHVQHRGGGLSNNISINIYKQEVFL